MYKILCDGKVLYHPLLNDYSLTSAVLTQEVNKAGTLDIIVPASNKASLPKLLKSNVELYKDDVLIFKGRPYEPSRNLFGDTEITVAGELSFLYDSYHEPFDFFDTPSEFLSMLINNHNLQVEADRKFKVGICDVVNDTATGKIVRESESVMQTGKLIEDKLTKPLGGFLRLRHEQDGTYIDYLQEPYLISNQGVTQSINLLKYEEEIDTSGLATVIYPLGAKLKKNGKETNERLTIATVNGGKKTIEDTNLISRYGRISKVVYFDDITEAQNLLKAGQRELKNSGAIKKMTISASDLSKAGYNLDSFKLAQNVNLSVKNLGISEIITVTKLKTDLLNPSKSTLEVGHTKLLSDKIIDISKKADESYVASNAANRKADENIDQLLETKTVLESTIDQTATELQTKIEETTYSKGETDELLEQKSTEIQQNKDEVLITVSEVQKTAEGNASKIEESENYFRFDDSGLIIGEKGSKITAVHTNDAIEFQEDGVAVATFDTEGTNTRNVEVENQVGYFGQWVTRKGAKGPKGYNLNDVFIG